MHSPSDGPAVLIHTIDSNGARVLTQIDSISAASPIVVFEAPRSGAVCETFSISSLNAGYICSRVGSQDRYVAASSFMAAAVEAGIVAARTPPLLKRALDDLHVLATRVSAPPPVVNVHAERGPQGHQGPQGIQGGIGPRGYTGERGPQGVPGPQGERGPQGETGERGPKGDKGDTGSRGARGYPGAPGAGSVLSVNSMIGDVTIQADSIAFGPTYVSSAFETKYTVSSAISISGAAIAVSPNSGTAGSISLTTIGNVGNNLFSANYRDAIFSPSVTLRHSRGTPSSPAALASLDRVFLLTGQGQYGTGANDQANAFNLVARIIAASPSSADMQSQMFYDLVPAAAGITPTEAYRHDTTNGIQIGGAGNTVIWHDRIHQQRTLTLSTMPSASPAGRSVYVSNATGKPRLAFSTGSEWLMASSVTALV